MATDVARLVQECRFQRPDCEQLCVAPNISTSIIMPLILDRSADDASPRARWRVGPQVSLSDAVAVSLGRLLAGLLIVLFLAGCAAPWSPTSVTVEWSTASEVDHAGFNLYRGDGPDGPWVRLNRDLIPPAGDPIVGGHYTYVDETVEPGHTYYYLLEDVSLTGTTTRHPPIMVVAGPGGSWGEVLWGVLAGLLLAGVILVSWRLWQRQRMSFPRAGRTPWTRKS